MIMNLLPTKSEITAEIVRFPTDALNIPPNMGILAFSEKSSIILDISWGDKLIFVMLICPALFITICFPGPGHSIAVTELSLRKIFNLFEIIPILSGVSGAFDLLKIFKNGFFA